MLILVLRENTEQWQRDTFTPGTSETGEGLLHIYNKMFWYNVEILENVHKSFPVMIESESKCFLEKRFSVFYNLVTALSFVSQFLLLDLILQKISVLCKRELEKQINCKVYIPN